MSKATAERITLLRKAASDGRNNPEDLFGARMTIHNAFEGAGLDCNRICDLLLSSRPPISELDCCRLEMVADLLKLEPDARAEQLYGLCKIPRMIIN
jgi:hypothetical protein